MLRKSESHPDEEEITGGCLNYEANVSEVALGGPAREFNVLIMSTPVLEDYAKFAYY
jgi:hypothetical protein